MVQSGDGHRTVANEKGPVSGKKREGSKESGSPGVDHVSARSPKDKDPITYNNMALAIGAFERGLVTPSAWDAFIQGDQSALTDAQKSGFNTFAATGCQWCHAGPYVGGSAYQKLGVVKPWPN